MKTHLRIFVLGIAMVFCHGKLEAGALDNWNLRNPGVTPNNLRAVTSGNGLFVAVGNSGTIATSSDAGESWTGRESGLTNLNIGLRGVAYGNGIFIAVPDVNANNSVLISTNGTNWSVTTAVFTNISVSDFAGITFGGGKFAALVSGSGAVVAPVTSSGSSQPQTNIISAGGNQGSVHVDYEFFGVSDQMTIFYDGTNIFDSGYVSGTGQVNVNFGPGLGTNVTIIMNQFTNPNPTTAWNYTATITGPGFSTTNAILTSTDGLTWTPQNAGTNGPFKAITYAQNQFVAVGGVTTPTNRGFIVTSPDGVAWTTRRTNVPAILVSIAGNSTSFAAVGGRTTSRSTAGVTWTDATDAGVPGRNAIGAGTNQFVSTDATAGINDFSTIYTSTDGAAWSNRATTESLTAITFSGGRFVAVGNANDVGFSPLGTRPAFYISDDGIAWRSRFMGMRTSTGLLPGTGSAVAYGNGVFILLATNTTLSPMRYVSTNGADWYENPMFGLSFYPPRGATFGAGLFVAVGGYEPTGNSFIASSGDGTNWTQQYQDANGPFTAAVYGGGQFVAIGQAPGDSERTILTSPDGVNWGVQFAGMTNDLFGVAHGSGAYVAVGAKGTVARSTDGVNWTNQSITASNQLNGVTFGGGQFVAVGGSGRIFTSPTGETWTLRTSGTARDLNTVIYFNGQFIAGGDAGLVLVSSNGVNWSAVESRTDLGIRAAATNSNQLVLAGELGLVDNSTNGTNWTLRNLTYPASVPLFREVLAVDDRIVAMGSDHARSPTGRTWAGYNGAALLPGNGAAYANGVLVAVGLDAVNQTTVTGFSTNRGESWTTNILGTLGQLYAVTYGAGKFVAVGDRPGGSNAVILTSTNGSNWTFRNSGFPAGLWDVAFGNGLFVAVGTSGGIRSADGITWVTNSGAKGETVAFGDGKFVASGPGALVSPNGTNWFNSDMGAGVLIENVQHGAGNFVAVGPSGIYSSTNGSNWVNRFVRTRQKLNATVFANDSFFVVGFGGTIYQSDFLTNTPAQILQGPQPVSVLEGADVGFTARVTGRLPMTFQWLKNGAPISGATELDLFLNDVTLSDAGNYQLVVSNEFGSQTSSSAALTVFAVSAAVSPEQVYLFTNTTGGFSSSVTGGTPIGYQWYTGAIPVPGATNATLTFTNVQTTNAGSYSVLVKLPYGEIFSTNEGNLSVFESLDEVSLGADPSFLQLPTGNTANTMAIVYGPTPLSYQWLRNETNLPGATNAMLVINNVQTNHSDTYGLKVTYSMGNVTNDFAFMLDVYHAEPPVITGTTMPFPGLMEITFTGLVGRYYRVEYATNLAAPVDWQLYGNYQVTANPTTVPVTVPLFGYSNVFFRIMILPP